MILLTSDMTSMANEIIQQIKKCGSLIGLSHQSHNILHYHFQRVYPQTKIEKQMNKSHKDCMMIGTCVIKIDPSSVTFLVEIVFEIVLCVRNTS